MFRMVNLTKVGFPKRGRLVTGLSSRFFRMQGIFGLLSPCDWRPAPPHRATLGIRDSREHLMPPTVAFSPPQGLPGAGRLSDGNPSRGSWI